MRILLTAESAQHGAVAGYESIFPNELVSRPLYSILLSIQDGYEAPAAAEEVIDEEQTF
jgi:hypothetical protein